METFLHLVSISFLFFFFVQLGATVLMGRVGMLSNWKLPALNERFLTGVVQTVSAFGLAILGANRLFQWNMERESVLLILSLSLAIKVIPSLVWLYLYKTDGFHDDGSIKEDF